MKRLAFFDVAGTLIDGNPWRALLKTDRISRVRLGMLYPWLYPVYFAKEIGVVSDATFRQVWIRQMAWLLGGLPKPTTDQLFAWIASEYMVGDYRDDVVARLQAHRANGDYIVLISGMFTPFTRAFADHLQADAAIGTGLGFDATGHCTGRIVGEGCAGERKAAYLQDHLLAQGISLSDHETFAYADSFSDAPLLYLADHPVATYPDEKLSQLVTERGWEQMG